MEFISGKLQIALHALEDGLVKAGKLEKLEQEERQPIGTISAALYQEKQQLQQDLLQISEGLVRIANFLPRSKSSQQGNSATDLP